MPMLPIDPRFETPVRQKKYFLKRLPENTGDSPAATHTSPILLIVPSHWRCLPRPFLPIQSSLPNWPEQAPHHSWWPSERINHVPVEWRTLRKQGDQQRLLRIVIERVK